MAYTGMPDLEVYTRAIRASAAVWYTVDATLGGSPVAGAAGLAPTGGSVLDTMQPGVRRQLQGLELDPAPGLFDLLAPIGTRLEVTAHVRLTSRKVIDIPMGVFDVNDEKLTTGGGTLSITADDKWAIVARGRFLQPYASTPGISVSSQIVALLRYGLGSVEQINEINTSTAVMGAQTWDEQCDTAILDLAKGAGLWVYFDRLGVATVADMPTIGPAADWLVDASASGVITDLDRERSRERTRNVVRISSTAADGEAFPSQLVWDTDPTSPTYAGTDPINVRSSAGPFGIVPLAYETALPLTASQAVHTAQTILYTVTGLASQVSLGAVPNPAVDAGDVLDVLPVRERYDIPRVLERHIADTVTTPLTNGDGQPQHIDGRSTRTDDYT